MGDSTLTLPLTRSVIFRHDFHYTGWTVKDSVLTNTTATASDNHSFVMAHQADGFHQILQHTGHPENWIFWMILSGLILLVLAKVLNEKRLWLLISSVFSRNSANQLVKESGFFHFESIIFLFAIYLISSTLLFYLVFRYFGLVDTVGNWMDIILYMEIVGAVVAFFLVKVSLIRLGGSLFRNPETASEYIQTMVIYNLFGGIVLLPLLLFICYGPTDFFLYFTLGVLAILMILRFVRGVAIGLSDRKFSLFYLFLYLCTLEILPVFVVAKFIDKYFFQ